MWIASLEDDGFCYLALLVVRMRLNGSCLRVVSVSKVGIIRGFSEDTKHRKTVFLRSPSLPQAIIYSNCKHSMLKVFFLIVK